MTVVVDKNLNIITFPCTIDNFQYSENTPDLFDDGQLANIGLYKVQDFGAPSNTIIISSSIEMINKIPTVIYNTKSEIPITNTVIIPVPVSSNNHSNVKSNTFLSINCASNPQLTGVFGVGAQCMANLACMGMYISLNNTFPANQTSLNWLDYTGNNHVFANTEVFYTFFNTVMNFNATRIPNSTVNTSISIP